MLFFDVYQYAPNLVEWVDPWGWAALRRPYIRKSTRQTIESRAKIKKGLFLDENTGLLIEGSKRRLYSLAEGQYDLGHKPGHEHWRMAADAEAQDLNQKQFNDLMNNPDLYQIEDPMENQSHRHEDKSRGTQNTSSGSSPCD